MTRERDIEHVLEAWLEPGPREAPDRVLLAITDRIDRVPQRRFPHANERFHHMTPILKLTAAAVLAIAVGVTVGPRLVSSDIFAQPKPDPSPSPSPAPTLLSEGLRYSWAHVPMLDAPAGQAVILEFSGEDSLSIADGLGLHLWQHVALTEAGVLQLTLFPGLGGCGEAEDATYSYRVSPGGTKLTLTAEADECAERAAILAGDYQRDSCANSNAPCLGPMEAGTYVSMKFAPGADPATKIGGLEVEVPAGWTNTEDTPNSYLLMPNASHAYQQENPDSWPAMIAVLARPSAAAQTTDCSNPPAQGVGHTIDDLVAWLTSQPGLVTGEPETIEVGPYSGTALDVDIDPTWTTTCTGYPSPVVAAIRTDGVGAFSSWEVGGLGTPRDPSRFLLLQIDESHVVLVIVYPGATSTPRDFYGEAMPVIESMRFMP